MFNTSCLVRHSCGGRNPRSFLHLYLILIDRVLFDFWFFVGFDDVRGKFYFDIVTEQIFDGYDLDFGDNGLGHAFHVAIIEVTFFDCFLYHAFGGLFEQDKDSKVSALAGDSAFDLKVFFLIDMSFLYPFTM